MDALAKLVKKLGAKEREALLMFLSALRDPTERKTLDLRKLSDSSLYRARKGNFRAICHLEGDRMIIDAVRMRNEKTYRDV